MILFVKKNDIAEFDGDECFISLEVIAGRHIEEYNLMFKEPKNTDIRLIDYYSDKIENSPDQNSISIKSRGKDNISIGVYLEDRGYNPQGANPFQVIQADTDDVLTEITIS